MPGFRRCIVLSLAFGLTACPAVDRRLRGEETLDARWERLQREAQAKPAPTKVVTVATEPEAPVAAVAEPAGLWSPGSRDPARPNLVAGRAPGEWRPDPGYQLAAGPPPRAVWTPGLAHPTRAHVESADLEGRWRTAPGYTFRGDIDGEAVWSPGAVHPSRPGQVAGAEEGTWVPAPAPAARSVERVAPTPPQEDSPGPQLDESWEPVAAHLREAVAWQRWIDGRAADPEGRRDPRLGTALQLRDAEVGAAVTVALPLESAETRDALGAHLLRGLESGFDGFAGDAASLRRRSAALKDADRAASLCTLLRVLAR